MRRQRQRLGVEALEGRSLMTAGVLDYAAKWDVRGYADSPSDVAIQPGTNRTIVAGQTSGSKDIDSYLMALKPDGTLDTSFGSGGKTVIDLAGKGLSDEWKDIAILPGGKIVALGRATVKVNIDSSKTDYQLVVARFNANGTLDTTFGSSGLVKLNPSAFRDTPGSLALAGDKMVVSGVNGAGGSFLYRLNANGTLDTTFSGDGYASYAMPNSGTVAADATGYTLLINGGLQRINLDGSLNTTWGENGTGKVALPYNTDGMIQDPATGRLLFSGIDGQATTFDHLQFMTAYTADGYKDATFGTEGIVWIPFATPADPNAGPNFNVRGKLAMDGAGNVYYSGALTPRTNSAGGAVDDDIYVYKFSATGVQDTSFGNTGLGYFVYDYSPTGDSYESVAALTVDSQGRLIIAGNTSANGTQDTLIIRLS